MVAVCYNIPPQNKNHIQLLVQQFVKNLQICHQIDKKKKVVIVVGNKFFANLYRRIVFQFTKHFPPHRVFNQFYLPASHNKGKFLRFNLLKIQLIRGLPLIFLLTGSDINFISQSNI